MMEHPCPLYTQKRSLLTEALAGVFVRVVLRPLGRRYCGEVAYQEVRYAQAARWSAVNWRKVAGGLSRTRAMSSVTVSAKPSRATV
jgi:hypothetical protein